MSETTSTTQALIALLEQAKLAPRITRPRTVLPAQFDPLYGVSVAGCALEVLGTRGADGALALHPMLLRFASFLAARPNLLTDYLDWRAHQTGVAQLDLEAWPLLPRGFWTDRTSEAVLTYLGMCGDVTREANVVKFYPAKGRLSSLLNSIREADLLASERGVLRELARNRPTLKSLGVE